MNDAAWRRECDVAVVGAGPAGSMAALAAARKGAEVIVLERRRQIGLPVRCAGLLPVALLRDVPATARAVIQRTTGIVTHLPDGDQHEMAVPGAMLDRGAFDRALSAAAASAGSEVWTQTAVVAVEDGLLVADRRGVRGTVRARVTIGADGPRSIIGRHVGLANDRFAVAKQRDVSLSAALSATHVFFDPLFYGGYGWLFPKGERANLGVAVDMTRHGALGEAIRILTARVEELRLVTKDSAVSWAGGLIPVGGPLGSARVGPVILAGDAAGQTHPITGAGIHAAVFCGGLAGEVAADFVASGDEEDLARYERDWRSLWGSVLERGLNRRSELLMRWDEDLSAALRRCWVVFQDYYA